MASVAPIISMSYLSLKMKKIDIYGGASVLYKYYNSVVNEPFLKASGGNLDMAIHAGDRCLFTRKVGAFIELGYGTFSISTRNCFQTIMNSIPEFD